MLRLSMSTTSSTKSMIDLTDGYRNSSSFLTRTMADIRFWPWLRTTNLKMGEAPLQNVKRALIRMMAINPRIVLSLCDLPIRGRKLSDLLRRGAFT